MERHAAEGDRDRPAAPAAPPAPASADPPPSGRDRLIRHGVPPGPGEPSPPAGARLTDRPPSDRAVDPGDEEDGAGSADGEEGRRGPLAFMRELPGLILIALALALLIKTFLIQAFYIPSKSMEPTLLVGDRVIVNKIVYRFRDPRPGEVVVFENPNLVEPDRNPISAFFHWITEGLGITTDPQKDFIKRVIAVPGQAIEVKGGEVFVDGERLEEPYLHRVEDLQDFGPKTIPEGRYFVMGDNRANSQDSRVFGAIPREKIVGKAFVVLWPPSRFSWLSSG